MGFKIDKVMRDHIAAHREYAVTKYSRENFKTALSILQTAAAQPEVEDGYLITAAYTQPSFSVGIRWRADYMLVFRPGYGMTEVANPALGDEVVRQYRDQRQDVKIKSVAEWDELAALISRHYRADEWYKAHSVTQSRPRFGCGCYYATQLVVMPVCDEGILLRRQAHLAAIALGGGAQNYGVYPKTYQPTYDQQREYRAGLLALLEHFQLSYHEYASQNEVIAQLKDLLALPAES